MSRILEKVLLMKISFNLIFGNNTALVKRQQTIEIEIIHRVKTPKLRILHLLQVYLHHFLPVLILHDRSGSL